MESPKKRFEYLVMEAAPGSPESDERWMKLGADGWELVTIQTLHGTVNGLSPMEISVTKSRLIFKREVVT
jgi:hypothetical protein